MYVEEGVRLCNEMIFKYGANLMCFARTREVMHYYQVVCTEQVKME